MPKLFKMLDLPPVWTAAGLALMAGLASWIPVLRLDRWFLDAAGWLVIAMALALMVWAARAVMVRGTPIMPRREPSALVIDGPFRCSRNPIYLADLMILAGAALILGALTPPIVLPLFVLVINRRFIAGEERALAAAFGETFAAFRRRTRRWV